MINDSLALCPLYLSYKDNKNWSWSIGSVPPTIVGMNVHMSEVVSEFVEPVVDTFEGGWRLSPLKTCWLR